MTVEHNDQTHVDLVNRYIKILNETKQEGYDTDFIASAITAAAAAFSAYAIARTGNVIDQRVLDHIASIYLGRLIDFLNQNHPDSLSIDLIRKN